MDNAYNLECNNCKYHDNSIRDFSHICKYCHNNSKFELRPNLDKIKKDELNHPVRYARNGVECIDIMIKIFGAEAVKIFCKLNAFKYLWRSDFKGKTEDIKKAVVYLNRYLEIDEEENNK